MHFCVCIHCTEAGEAHAFAQCGYYTYAVITLCRASRVTFQVIIIPFSHFAHLIPISFLSSSLFLTCPLYFYWKSQNSALLYFSFHFSRSRLPAEPNVAITRMMAQTTRFNARMCLYEVSLTMRMDFSGTKFLIPQNLPQRAIFTPKRKC